MAELFGNPEADTPNDLPTQETPVSTPEPEGDKQPGSVDDLSVLLSQIKAPDGRQKYADVQTALQSIPNAQNKILELSQQVQQLQEELNKRKGMEELLAQLSAAKGEQQSGGQPSQEGTPDIASVVQQMLEQREKEKTAGENRKKVVSALRDKFGDKAEEMYKAKAQELGMPIEVMNQLVAQSPAAVLAYFGTSSSSAADSTTASVNTAALQGMSPKKPEKDPMSVFRSQDSDLSLKWRAAGEKVKSQGV